MPAYVFVIRRQVTDAHRYAEYVSASGETLRRVEATVFPSGEQVESWEGPPVDGAVVVEFRDVEHARTWFGSDDYEAVRALRQGAAELEIFVADFPAAIGGLTSGASPVPAGATVTSSE